MLIVVLLLILWVALVAIGFLVKTLLWLAVVGLALFVVTVVVSAIRYSRIHQD